MLSSAATLAHSRTGMWLSVIRSFTTAISATQHFPTSPEHANHVKINQRILQCRNSKEVEQLVLKSDAKEFNAVNCSTAVAQLAKFNQQNHKHLQHLHAKSPALNRVYSIAQKQYFMPRAIATFCHSLAAGGLDEEIPAFLLRQIQLGNNEDDEFPFKHYTPQGLSLVLWSFGKFGQCDEFVFSRASRELCLKRNLRDFDAQHISNIVWAFSRVKYNSDGVFRKTSLELQRREWEGLLPQHISTIALAFAKMKQHRHTPLLFHNMSRTCLMQKSNQEFAKEFKFQTIALLCFSFASMQHKDDELFQRFSRTLLRKSDLEWTREFTNQGMANVMWSFAKMALKDEELFKRCGALMLQRNDFTSPLTVATTLWSFSKLGLRDPALFERAAQAVRHQSFLEQFKAQELSNLMWAFAKAEHRDDMLIDQVCGELVNARQVEKFDAEDLAELLWSFVKLGAANKKRPLLQQQLVDKLAGEVKRRPMQEFSTNELANIVWALEAMGGNNEDPLAEFHQEIQIRRSAKPVM